MNFTYLRFNNENLIKMKFIKYIKKSSLSPTLVEIFMQTWGEKKAYFKIF